ncbi:MAG: ferritin family protein [Acidobacteria bacterium]|nr:ferritin family protein [Acidobacteriota bacterium]
MSETFSIEEIFRLAIEIERNGARFYRNAAETVDNSELKMKFNELAQMEKAHEEKLTVLKNKLSGKGKPLAGDISLHDDNFIRAFARTAVFNSPPEKQSFDSDSKIISFAMEKEQESITYYEALKELLDGAQDKKIIQLLIDEEKEHLALLSSLQQ